jgi:hypothetical protein
MLNNNTLFMKDDVNDSEFRKVHKTIMPFDGVSNCVKVAK